MQKDHLPLLIPSFQTPPSHHVASLISLSGAAGKTEYNTSTCDQKWLLFTKKTQTTKHHNNNKIKAKLKSPNPKREPNLLQPPFPPAQREDTHQKLTKQVAGNSSLWSVVGQGDVLHSAGGCLQSLSSLLPEATASASGFSW